MKLLIEYIFIVIFILIDLRLTSSLKSKIVCIQNGVCKCAFPNGYVIDLTNLKTQSFNQSINNATITFHPCRNVEIIDPSAKSNDCKDGTSLCLFNNQTMSYTNLGKAEDGKFLPKSFPQDGQLQFHANDRITTITLKCMETLKPELHFSGPQTNMTNIELEFYSPESCRLKAASESKGMSVGSVLVLMLITFLIVYFGGGVLTLKFLRGAEGKEMIPNYEFWADLPYLVRDGIIFTLSGFQASPSYDRI